MYLVLEAEPLVYLTMIIQGLVAWCVQSVGSRALGVADQDYKKMVAFYVYCVLVVEP